MGIDPGLNCTGYGVVDRLPDGRCRLVEAGAVRTAASAALETRLRVLYDGICEALDDLHPEVVIVESLYSKYSHPRTAILMGHARGVIYLAAQERGMQVEAYPASQVKRALTGAGRADKEQVAEMVCRMLALPEIPRPHDVTDALALALCHATPQRFGEPYPLTPSLKGGGIKLAATRGPSRGRSLAASAPLLPTSDLRASARARLSTSPPEVRP